MKTKEIIRKSLPNFYSDFCNTVHRMMSFKDATIFVDRFSELLASDIQNFADRICEKQRENCTDSYVEKYEDQFEEVVHEAIFNAEQPKIDEL